MKKTMTKKPFYPWIVLLLSASFLFYKYILQVSPSVMTTELMQNFHVSGAGLGNLAATYFYSYVIAQLFVGPLLDRYNPRIMTASAMGVCAIGAYCFSQSHSLTEALLSRGLIGIGVSFATVSYMKMSAVWFKPNQFAFVSGLAATAAMVGSMSAQVPMELLVHHTSWRVALFDASLLGAMLAVLFYLFVRTKPVSSAITGEMQTPKLKDFMAALQSKNNWLLTFYSGLSFSPLAVLGGLWGNPFLQEAYHFSTTTAAGVSTCMFLGLAAGAPIFSMLSNRMNRRYEVMQIGIWLSLISIVLVIYLPSLSAVVAGILLFSFGFGVGAFMLGFTLGKELNALALAATIIALINTGDAIFGAFTEPFIGKLLDIFWNGDIVNGVPHFTIHAYHAAFVVLPLYLIVASLLLVPLKKVCKITHAG
jgi:MFS family permease